MLRLQLAGLRPAPPPDQNDFANVEMTTPFWHGLKCRYGMALVGS